MKCLYSTYSGFKIYDLAQEFHGTDAISGKVFLVLRIKSNPLCQATLRVVHHYIHLNNIAVAIGMDKFGHPQDELCYTHRKKFANK